MRRRQVALPGDGPDLVSHPLSRLHRLRGPGGSIGTASVARASMAALACSLHAALPLNSRTLFAMTGVRYSRGWGGRGALIREHPQCYCGQPGGRRNALSTKDLPMSSTFDAVANIIAETCDIPRETIKPESHAINDLGIDSLDFLDVAFAIDKAFGIKMPLEQWTQEVNEGKATTEQYFVMKNLCAHIDGLVAAKGA
jgi:acyl carrier protein